ncbi:MAG: hypothetical protein R3A49_13390 [Acidimicrobiia bacterium]
MSPVHAVASEPVGLATHGLDLDRVGHRVPLRDALRRRYTGQFPIDPFGGDPLVQDFAVPVAELAVSVDVENVENIPSSGPAVLIANRGFGVAEPAVLSVGVRRDRSRRLRVVGMPELPGVFRLGTKLGMIKGHAGDLRAVLRAGHLAAVPLGPTGLRCRAGALPPTELLTAVVGYRVIPVAVIPEGPLGLPARSWRVIVGEHVELDDVFGAGDPLGAAELAELARQAVQELIDGR